jgi:hypothetical protein
MFSAAILATLSLRGVKSYNVALDERIGGHHVECDRSHRYSLTVPLRNL